MSKHPYVSCIKINGTPILPPLITSERRKELNLYKQQAIKLEQRLQNCRDLRQHLKDLLETQCLIERPHSELTFGDNSHIEALGISNNGAAQKRTAHLSSDIIEISQYVDDTVEVIFDESDSKRRCDSCESPRVSLASSVIVKNENKEQSEGEPELPNKPRLIRSNSYTVETPSPILLAHLRKNSDWNQVSSDSTERTRSSSESGAVNQNDKCVENVDQPTIEVFQTDISVQQILVNTNKSDDTIEQKKATFFSKNAFDVLDADCEFMKVLKEIPENYAEQIMELIHKQQSEQQRKFDRCDDIYSESVKEKNNKNLFDDLEGVSKPRNKIRRSSTFSMSPSESLYYSLSESETLTAPNTPSLKLIDLESKSDASQKNEHEVIISSKNHHSISRELFPDRTEWAASVIGAHVRGYLTRRLFRTEKVQKVIETINDAVMCALELHRSDNIDEQDVELHRRLLHQISAACYAFHDIFFVLSVRDRMQIIAADRQRKIDKLTKSVPGKRPSSAKSSRSVGSHSSLNTSRSASKHRISMSQSATKV